MKSHYSLLRSVDTYGNNNFIRIIHGNLRFMLIAFFSIVSYTNFAASEAAVRHSCLGTRESHRTLKVIVKAVLTARDRTGHGMDTFSSANHD